MDFITDYFTTTQELMGKLHTLSPNIHAAATACSMAISQQRKVMFCGNGGSAADAQHLAAELMGRFLMDRAPMAAMALTVDTSALTAIGNDYGFDKVFSRQVRGIGQRGDVLIGISTSGNSENIVDAFEVAKEMGITTVGLTGATGGFMYGSSDILINVPHTQTNHIQEAHIAIGHIICAIVESTICSK